MSDTIYCGSGKKQNDGWLKVTVNMDKVKDHIQEFKGTKFIRLNINLKDELDQYGKDVSISVDTWEPESSQNGNEPATKAEPIAVSDKSDDSSLPF